MDKKFEKWIEEFDIDYKKSKTYNVLTGRGYSEVDQKVLGWYLQFKQQQSSDKLVYWTRWLVFATWALCGITLLLVKFG